MEINCDIGEEWGPAARKIDAQLMPYITSCNVACGYHSGSREIMEATIRMALQHDVKIGAHPSYNDRANFGRKTVQVSRKQLKKDIIDQLSALQGICSDLGAKMDYVKPHGALYNDMHPDDDLAELIIDVVQEFDAQLKIMVMAGSSAAAVCEKKGVPYIREVFSDRAYVKIDELRSRKYSDAVYDDIKSIKKRIADLQSGQLTLHNGEVVELVADSICIHGDTDQAVNIAQVIYHSLSSSKS